MDKTDMRAVDVNSNFKNWPAWDYKDYRLGQKEAKACTDALDNYIWYDVEKQGMPKEDGWYLFKAIDHYSNVYYTSFYYTQDSIYPTDITHWRKIVDNENAYMEEQ